MKSRTQRKRRTSCVRFLASILTLIPCSAIGITSMHTLNTYDELVNALTTGKAVSTLLDLALCTRDGTDTPGPNVRGGAPISRFIIPNGQYVGFADTHMTLDTEDRPVTEYIRYRAMPDGAVTVRFATRLETSSEVTLRGKFRCAFNRGIRFMDGDAPRSHPLGF